jgi:hypothetical protein
MSSIWELQNTKTETSLSKLILLRYYCKVFNSNLKLKVFCCDINIYSQICEVAFLKILGLSSKSQLSSAPILWRLLRKVEVDKRDGVTIEDDVTMETDIKLGTLPMFFFRNLLA